MEQDNKFCPNRGCKFYEKSANGVPFYENCYMCTKPLVSQKPDEHSEGKDIIKDQPGPKISEEKCTDNPWNPISKSQKPNVKTDAAIIKFLTAILRSDYDKVKGNISLKFAHSHYGDFKFVCDSFTSRNKYYEGRDFILLENNIKIGSKILSCIEKSEYSLFIPYKFYLGEDGENLYLPQGDCFRSLIIGNSNFSESNVATKYDMIILPDGTEKESDIRDPATRLELLFNLYIPSVEELVRLSFHDIGDKIRHILFPLCYGYYSVKRHGIIVRKDFKANKNFLLYDSLEKMNELTTNLLRNWLMKVINNGSIPFHSKFLLLFVTFEKELIQSNSNELFCILIQKMDLTLLQDQSRLNDFLEYQSNMISSPLILHHAMKYIAEQKIELLINFLPIYHIIFDSQTEYEVACNKHDFENNDFWGLPSDTEFQCNNKIEISIIQNAINNFCEVDPLLANSIILLSMSDDTFPQLLELFPTHLSSFMCVLMYRVKKRPCFIEQDYKLRESVFITFLGKSDQIQCLSMSEDDICQACDVIFKMLAVINDQDKTQHCIHLEESKLILRVLAKLLCLFDEKCPQLLSEEYFHLAYGKIFHLKPASALLNILRGCLNPDVLDSNHKSDFSEEVSNIWNFLYTIQFPQPYKFLFTIDQLFSTKLKVQDFRSVLDTLVDTCSITSSQVSHSDGLNYSLCNEVISILYQTQTPEQEYELCVRCLVEVPIEHFNMIVEVFAKLLECISKPLKSDPVKHILSTKWWPKLINYCQPKHFEKSGHHDAASLIESVIHIVESLATSLQDQSIETKYFKLAIAHNDNCFSLLQLVSKGHVFTDLATFEKCLSCIDKDLHAFLHFRELMYDLKKLLDHTKTQMNSQILSDFLTIEFEDMSISSLCHLSIILPHSEHEDFFSNEEFVLMLESLPYLLQSQLFITTFANTFQECFKDNQFEFFELEIILDKIWYKASIFVSQIIRDLLYMKILLSDIDDHFGIYRRDPDKMGSEICNLLRGINTGTSNDFDKEEDRSEILTKIKHYFKLEQVRGIAEKIFEVKDAYGINGNFNAIKFINELNLEGKKLKDVSEDIVNIGTKLSHCDELHFEILKQMIVCINLFHWIIENLKNQRQLDNFADLALNQSSNSTFEVNRITCFKDVCRIFAPFIFKRQNETDQESFLVMLNAVHSNFKSSEQDECTILEMSEDCAKEIYFNFWKQLILNHTSIGGNIISKLKDILSEGVFYVKLERNFRKIEDVMSIQVGESKVYSLHELKEMQSEVVLITSERHDDKIGTQFQIILGVLMDFSEIVLKLYLSGNVFFRKTKENLSYPCNSIPMIKEDTAFLEKEYNSWINNLEKARDMHYYLNYFTSSQIIAMQLSLDSYLKNKNIELDQEFFHLLSLIKENLTIEDVKTVIKRLNEGSHSITNSFMNILPNSSLELSLNCQISNVDLDSILTPIRNPRVKFAAPFQTEITTFLETDDGAKLGLQQNYDKETKANLNPLDTLEKIFEKLSSYSKHQVRRDFPVTFKEAEPNILFVKNSDILTCLLAIYMPSNSDFEFPQTHEILLCSEDTTLEEVDIFLRRALKYPFLHIVCIAFIEKLRYEVAVESVSLFKKYVSRLKSDSNYRLVLICSDECKTSSYMATAFARYTRISPSDKHIDKKLVFKIISQSSEEITAKKQAWQVDPDRSYIRVVTSKSSGNGKTLTVLRQVKKLKSFTQSPDISSLYTTIAIHEGEGFEDKVVQTCIKSQLSASDYGRIYHFDLISDSDRLLIPFLFKLLVTRTLCDYSGNIWRFSKNNYYMIEINLKSRSPELEHFLRLFPNWDCFSPNESIKVVEKPIPLLECQITKVDQLEYESDIYIRTHDYLSKLKSGSNMDKYKFDPKYASKIDLKLLLEYLELETPSWSELKHFLTFMNHQLIAYEKNVYCQSVDSDSNWRGFKKFVIDCLILMSLDFTTPSLRISLQSSIPSNELLGYSIDSKRKWEQKKNPYIFFNEDMQSMTFFGISIDKNLVQLDILGSNPLKEKKVISRQLYNILEKNRVALGENCNNWNRSKMISVLANVLGMQSSADLVSNPISDLDPDPYYVLTIDNLKKMLAIQMRFRSNIPVILMGETGCGKTRLIKFMCQLQAKGRKIDNVIIFKIHGEIYKSDIIDYYQRALKLAKENASKNIDTILFFDEVNTSYSIGLIKEILCDRRIDGASIPNDLRLQFVAACNPYRKHTEEMLSKLTSAGLGMFNASDKVREHFGTIPLRELVYRVLPLPDSLLPLVWDFGTLDPESERSYIQKIVDTHLSHAEGSSPLAKAIATVLLSAQMFMRDKDDECSFVSLRDVERTLKVMVWFQKLLPKIDEKKKLMATIESELNLDTRSLILSIAVCYRAKLVNREDFDKDISCKFDSPLDKITNAGLIFREVKTFQDVLVSLMTIGEHIAKNKALKENLFMMFVCIQLKIPLFIIGKPGTSKSLAKHIISHSLNGDFNLDGNKIVEYTQVYMRSYQCSQLTTSKEILNLFESCQTIQEESATDCVACVVLDEVGLAEDSPSLPLKILHPLLEDGDNATNKQRPNIAFIGLSNWALDPAKMNRGIMLRLENPTLEDIVYTGQSIIKSSEREDIISLRKLMYNIPNIAQGYLKLIEEQQRKGSKDYFGLRDLYHLIKMLNQLCKEYGTFNARIFNHAILRNFGGITKFNVIAVFENFPLDLESEIGPRSDILSLIRSSLLGESELTLAEEEREKRRIERSRYLLLLTENYAALDILFHSEILKNDAKVIFGRIFPLDQEYFGIYHTINRIKVFMETGKVVVLTNLSNVYESLYELLNLFYVDILGKSWVDIGIGSQRIKCPVHPDFRLIVIADKNTVFDRFPPPLINRLEKHNLTFSTILEDDIIVKDIIDNLSRWVKNFVTIHNNESSYIRDKCFIGIQNDTLPFMVYSSIRILGLKGKEKESMERILDYCKLELLKIAPPDSILRIRESQLAGEADKIYEDYCTLKLFDLGSYLEELPNTREYHNQSTPFLSYITTYSTLLTVTDIEKLDNKLNLSFNITSLNLSQFKSEREFISAVKEDILTEVNHQSKRIIIIQCEDGHSNFDLVSCAKYKVMEIINEMSEKLNSNYHFVFITQLLFHQNPPKHSSFCGGNWDSVYIDELRDSSHNLLPPFDELTNYSVAEVFNYQHSKTAESNRSTDIYTFQKWRLIRCIQKAVCGLHSRNADRINYIVHLLTKPQFTEIADLTCKIVSNLLDCSSNLDQYSKEWSRIAALESDHSTVSTTFTKALSSHIDDLIVPLFSDILAIIDINENLNLIFPKLQCTKLAWEHIYQDENILRWNSLIDDFSLKFPNNSKKCLLNENQFPFFALIHQQVDRLFNEMNTNLGIKETCKIFEDNFNQSSIGKMMSLVQKKSKKNEFSLNADYLRDFILYHMMESKEELQQYRCSFIIMSVAASKHRGANNQDLIVQEDFFQKLPDYNIPSIHIAYSFVKERVFFINEAFNNGFKFPKGHSISSDNCLSIPSNYSELQNIDFEIFKDLVDTCWEDISKLQVKDPKWFIEKFTRYSCLIEENWTFFKSFSKEIDLLRNKWECIQCVHLFITHFLTESAFRKINSKTNTIRIQSISIFETAFDKLSKISPQDGNFHSSESIKSILDTIKSMKDGILSLKLEELNHKCETSKEGSSCLGCLFELEFQNQAIQFFLQILMKITFASATKLQEDLIHYFIEFIFNDQTFNLRKEPMYKLYSFNKIEPSSSLRCMLLQHLLRYSRSESINNQIENRIAIICPDLKAEIQAENLILIVLQSLEDYHHHQYKVSGNDTGINYILSQLKNTDLLQPFSSKDITYELIKSVAIIKFAIYWIVKWNVDYFLYDKYINSQKFSFKCIENHQRSVKATNLRLLIDEFVNLIEAAKIHNISTTIQTYLLKTLYFHVGYGALLKYQNEPKMEYFFPKVSATSGVGSKGTYLDLFYGIDPSYQKVLQIRKKDQKSQIGEKKVIRNIIFLIFTKCTSNRINNENGLTQRQKHTNISTDELKKDLTQLASSLPKEPIDLQSLAAGILDNKLFNMKEMSISEETHLNTVFIAGVLCHVGILLQNTEHLNFLKPLTQIHYNPSSLKKHVFPTIEKISNSSGLNKYSSTRSKDSESLHTNRIVSYKPHVLGDPFDRPRRPSSIRDLTAISVSLIRALMHGIFIWTLHTKHFKTPGTAIGQLVEPIHNNTHSQYFYLHLVQDIIDIATISNKTFEEAVLLVHLLFDTIVNERPCASDTSYELTNEAERQSWELSFQECYIVKLEKYIDVELREKMIEIISKSNNCDSDLLLNFYEKEGKRDFQSILWRHRHIIGYEHLLQRFNCLTENPSNKYPLLKKFLKEESLLKATRYLPDYVRLRIELIQKSLEYSSKVKISELTIGEFLQLIEKEDGNSYDEFKDLFTSLLIDWKEFRRDNYDPNNSFLPKYINYEIDYKTTKIRLLIGTACRDDEGLLMSLIKVLVGIHNSFIREYTKVFDVPSSSGRRVPLSLVSPSHIIKYKHQLDNVILSNATYSFRMGEGALIQYDFNGIQNELGQRFFFSKPNITLEDFDTEFPDQTHIIGYFQDINSKIKQIELPDMDWNAIKEELDKPVDISDVISLIEMVVKLTPKDKVNPDKRIAAYLEDYLKYPKKKNLVSKKANEVCCLKHLSSLWHKLNIHRSKIYVNIGQPPFPSISSKYLKNPKMSVIKELMIDLTPTELDAFLVVLHDFVMFNLILSHKEVDLACSLRESLIKFSKEETVFSAYRKEFDYEKISATFTESEAVKIWTSLVSECHLNTAILSMI